MFLKFAYENFVVWFLVVNELKCSVHLEDADGMAINQEPEQTALGLHCWLQTYLSQFLRWW